jgi:hypothetical protein
VDFDDALVRAHVEDFRDGFFFGCRVDFKLCQCRTIIWKLYRFFPPEFSTPLDFSFAYASMALSERTLNCVGVTIINSGQGSTIHTHTHTDRSTMCGLRLRHICRTAS